MQSLLDAIKDGRLVELPDNDKETSLRYLAHLVEAIPEIVGNVDLAEEVSTREKASNTGIGLGVACPHVRIPGNGPLLCAVGWSPTGIDYGAPDGKSVHLIFMYYIPDSAKNTYLKEVSSVVTAIKKENGIDAISHAGDITTVRTQLLDWVAAAINDAGVPETKARMVRLEARQAVIDKQNPSAPDQIFPVLILSETDSRQIVLCQDRDVVSILENDPTLSLTLKQNVLFERGNYKFIHRTTTLYDPSRPLYEYIAIKTAAL